jgi:MYXO-CTERM domain-containing protein
MEEDHMTARTKVAAWAGLMMVLWAPLALAQESDECAADADCEAGFVCQVVGGGACPAIDCAEGEKCDFSCDAVEIMGCVPGPCDSDADCGESQVCYKDSYEECSGGSASSEPCSRDGECPEPLPAEEPVCTTVEWSQCVPRWAAPCEEAADCGPGFTCEAFEECSCVGSAGGSDAACAEGEECAEPEPLPEPECTCTPSDVNYCKLVETPCVEDGECGDGLVCADAGGGVAVSCAGSAGGSDDGSEPAPADGGTPEESCEPVESEPDMLCVPADYELFGFSAYDVASGEATASLGGVEEDGAAGGRGPGGDNGGESPQDPSESQLDGDDGSNAAESEDGCSVTSARGATSQGLWLLLAAVFLVRRRRG